MSQVAKRVLVGVGGAVALAAIALGLLSLSQPPIFSLREDVPFIGVQTGGKTGPLWLDISTPEPISADDPSSRFEITAEVLGKPGSVAHLVIGGSLAAADPTCSGMAANVGEPERINSDDDLWPMLTAYNERRPGTGRIFGVAGIDARAKDEAESWLREQDLFIARNVSLAGSVTREWQPDDSTEMTSYELGTATMTCTFDRSALTQELLYRTRFRGIDLIVAHSSQDGDNLLRVDYDLEIQSDEPIRFYRSTFTSSESRIDESRDLITSYTGDWWARNYTGEIGITLAAGATHWEPSDAPGWRSRSQLFAGLFASLSLATLSAAIAYGVSRSSWGTR
ncbi:hypothetical protein P0L94_00770 [Microbacter sp. GSS18]|nr:hypothetical protein P0L94_00770 [Microbacter sp. GSS18]